MLNKFFGWFDAFKVCCLAAIIWASFNVYFIIQNHLNPPELKEFKGGIQNHLVWSNKGECFFVRPATGQTVYLVKVEDCDKK
jgi:hypothetical protein